jgi:hypothetical protein
LRRANYNNKIHIKSEINSFVEYHARRYTMQRRDRTQPGWGVAGSARGADGAGEMVVDRVRALGLS